MKINKFIHISNIKKMKIIKNLDEKKDLQNQIKFMAYHDALTSLPNRVLFFNNLKFLLGNESYLGHGALLSIDIDDFKSINDNLGHDYGDILLKLFAQLLNTCVKNYGELSHLGGDEFVVLVKNINSTSLLEKLCQEILSCLKTPFELKEKQVYITASIGITLFPQDSSDVNTVLKYADLAMHQSKSQGKNTYTFFEKKLADTYLRKILISEELKNCICNNELFILYQPQMDLNTNKIAGVESLLRWKNPKLGFVSPAEFIPIAEETGHIVEIGDWVLDQVCTKISQWQRNNFNFNKVSVNVSPIQIKRANFKNKLYEICKKNNIEPTSLEIEITEGTLIEIYKESLDMLNELIGNGINIALDDFGTGYSSLNYLSLLPVSTLKIDKSFVDKISNDKTKAVIGCIVDLSKFLKYKVIVEGVETKEQLDLIKELGCSIIQGYYFSKPVSESEIEFMFQANMK